MKKQILVMFGGESAEHEVSVVTGLQALEKLDTEAYEPHVVYVGKNGEMQYMGVRLTRKDFFGGSKRPCSFGKDARGGYLSVAGRAVTAGFGGLKIYPYAAFLAFHGGTGEAGQYQGLLEACGIPHTGSRVEGSAIAMNKQLTKQALVGSGVQVVDGRSVFAYDVAHDSLAVTRRLVGDLGLPVIVKPVHLGSSIGITIAKTETGLETALLTAAKQDAEILVEKLLTNFVEFNCSVRRTDGHIETSPVERPVAKDEILSFADKYQRGAKKAGQGAGMASLSREVPAQIPVELRDRIQQAARTVFEQCRMHGVPRIDFMYQKDTDTLYLTEPNPIPGSLAFYLWEAAGVPFIQQITDAIEEAVAEQQGVESRRLDYATDIVEKFCAQ